MNKTHNVLWSLLGLGAVLVVAYFAILGSSEPQPERKTLKVGVYDNHPKVFVDGEGDPKGIFVDILQSIAHAENLDLQFQIGEWSDLYEDLMNGNIDILPDVAYSEERDSLFILSVPVIGSWLQVFDDGDASLSSVTDLAGKRVGLLDGSIQEAYMSDFVKKQFDLDFTVITYPDYTATVQALKDREIDVFVADRFYYFSDPSDQTIRPTGIVLRPSDLHYAFSRDTDPEIIARVNRSLADLRNNPDSDYFKSVQYWFGTRYEPAIPEAVIWFFFIATVVLIVVSSFAITLNYKVKQKTRDLVAKNTELTAAKEKAEQSDRLKTVFLQNMSHEIRTPMNGILGFLELLRSPDLDDDTKSAYIDIMNVSGHRLMDTINNIVEISKIESGQVDVHDEVVNINQCLESNYEVFKYPAAAKGIDLNLHMGIGGHKADVMADKYILNIVFTNLLGNALKFTKKGAIDFGVSIEGDWLVGFVRDTGSGIAPERQQAIFERFVQADVESTRPYEGSGLGLAIVKAYLDMLGGEVWVESTIGVGSTFWFKIPYRPASQHHEEQRVGKNVQLIDREMKILVAEDDDISYTYLVEVIKSDKVKIMRATNGLEAVQLVRENPDFALVLMDIKMPEMDGLEATGRIRTFNADIPIVAQTAYALDGDREKALKSGCDEYIAKPFDSDHLLDIVNRFARAGTG
jgi:signal transduction histidine kinase/ActR/RegA family two-component response regulator